MLSILNCLEGSRKLISVIRSTSRKKKNSARLANNAFLPFPCPSPSSTIPCCYLCLHHHVWCSKPSAKCWTSSGKLWLKMSTSALQAVESRFQLRIPTDKLCQVFQEHLKGLGSPAALLCLSVVTHQWQKRLVSQFNLLLDAACSDQRCRAAAVQCLLLQTAREGEGKCNHRLQSSSGTNYCLLLRALTVFALHSRSTIEYERGNN